MLRAKTVFVLGAGSSHEVGLPLGTDLIPKVVDWVSNFYARNNQINYQDKSNSDQQILYWIQESYSGRYQDNQELQEDIRSLNSMQHLAISIDNYLHTHQKNTRLCKLGKIGIVASILQAEMSSKLSIYLPSVNIPYPHIESPSDIIAPQHP